MTSAIFVCAFALLASHVSASKRSRDTFFPIDAAESTRQTGNAPKGPR